MENLSKSFEKWFLLVRVNIYRIRVVSRKLRLPTPISKILGRILRVFRSVNERRLLQIYYARNESVNLGIIQQSIHFARRLMIWLIVLLIVAFLSDYLLSQIVNSLNIGQIGSLAIASDSPNADNTINSAILSVIQTYIGVIATIFGLFFALYIAGFELTTQQYSRDVAQYVNEERVSVFFFKWLLFAIIFNLAIVIRVWIVNSPAFGSFIFSTFVSLFSILTSLVYRSHSLLSSRPENIVRNLLAEFRHNLQLVTDKAQSEYNSVTVTKLSSDRVHKITIIIRDLYIDLMKKGDSRLAAIIPSAIAEMFYDYVSKLHLIRTNKTYWFPQTLQQIRRDEPFLGVVFSNFAIAGDGSMQLPIRNERWLQDLLIQLLDQFIDEAFGLNEEQINDVIRGIILAYKRLLYGEHQHRFNGVIKLDGLFDRQIFDEFEAVLSRLEKLLVKINHSERLRAEYLNTLYLVNQMILEGFRQDDVSSSLQLIETEPLPDKETIYELDLPNYLFILTQTYLDQLEVEQHIEGKIITPTSIIQQNMLQEIQSQEVARINDYFNRISRIAREWDSTATSLEQISSLKARLNWLKKAISHKRNDIVDNFEAIFSPELLNVLQNVDTQLLIDLELHRDLDDLNFLTLVNREKRLFNDVTRIRIYVYLILINHNTEFDRSIPLWRMILAVGCLSFGYSELDENSYWVTIYSTAVVDIYADSEKLVSLFDFVSQGRTSWLDSMIDYSYRDIWFNAFEKEISQLPVIIEEPTSNRPFPHAYFDHKSDFIRSLGPDNYRRIGVERKCIKGYISWSQVNLDRLNRKGKN